MKVLLFRDARRLRRAGALLLANLALALALAGAAGAVEMNDLYTTRVPWESGAPEGRADAYRRALGEVLVRVTGDAGAAGDPVLAELFAEPADYVLGYRPGAEGTLWVSFDGRAIAATLRSAGRPVWGSDRPLTLVWLAVDRGRGDRELIGAGERQPGVDSGRTADPNAFLRERLLERAAARGIPVAFPLLDAADREAVSASDVWGGFDERLLAAARRYDAPSVLIGRARDAGARISWRWVFDGEERNWSGDPETAVARIADSMAGEFALLAADGGETVALSVDGVRSLTAYGELSRYLRSLSIVEALGVREVRGDTIVFELRLLGDTARLRRTLAAGDMLRASGSSGVRVGPEARGEVLAYDYRP